MDCSCEATIEITKQEILDWIKVSGHVHTFEFVDDKLTVKYSMSQDTPFTFSK